MSSEPHTVRIERTLAIAGRRYVYAACDCGWEGPARETRSEALSDQDAHTRQHEA